MDIIVNEEQYNIVVALIDGFLNKAKERGGFNLLTVSEKQELIRLGTLVDHYEDDLSAVMAVSA